MSYINWTDLAQYIELAKQDFRNHHGVGELVCDLEVINGQETIVIESEMKRAYYAFRPQTKELELIQVTNLSGGI